MTPKKGATVKVSVQETETAMHELLYGTQCPSIKLAYWNSMLSLQCKLPVNCKHARIMAQYVNKPLPDFNGLIDVLGGDSTRLHNGKIARYPHGLMAVHINGLLAIEKLFNQGLLNFDCGKTLESQRIWRDKMVNLISGMGSKLVSWALFIYNPYDCLLMTVDTVHCSRIGVKQSSLAGSTKGKRENYCKIEDMLRAECIGLYPDKLPVIVAACLWLNYRNEGATSHKEISCRWY